MFFRLPLLMLAVIASVNATSISIYTETRPYGDGPLADPAAYVNNWNSLIATYPVTPFGYGGGYISDFENLNNGYTFGGSNSNIAFHTLINLNVSPSEVGTWTFRFGVDYGWGGVAYLDGNVLDFSNTDMWWAGSFGDPSQYLSGTSLLTAGNHTIELFGLEGCCDGATTGQFEIGTSDYRVFTATSDVPEPSSLVSMALGIGLIGLTLTRKKTRL